MDRADFEQWQSGKLFTRRYREIASQVDSADYFCKPEHQWLRDTYVASEFAEHVSAAAARLVPRPANRPDFEVRLRNGKVLSLEATEADRDGRRRGDEYRQWKSQGYPLLKDTNDDIEARVNALPSAVRSAVERKCNIQYPPGTGLVLYVNLGTYGASREVLEKQLVVCTACGRGHFAHIWALWSGKLYRCWPIQPTSL